MNGDSDLLRNDVPAASQLPDGSVSFFGDPDADVRVLFLGNSITRHGPKPEIGWTGDWGMAATSPEKDYVHRVARGLRLRAGKVFCCVAQLAEWERAFRDGAVLERYRAAREFRADLVLVRLGENVPREGLDEDALAVSFADMIRYFALREDCRILVTGLFWRYEPIDRAIVRAARAVGGTLVPLGDLGADDAMKALGEYSHKGVSIHPSDRGMAQIAGRILLAVPETLFPSRHRVYPVTDPGLPHGGYRVWVNGTEAPLNAARVSSVPFNRRWPGHQRQLDQTEPADFLLMESTGPVTFRVLPPEKCDSAVIRPASLGIRPRIEKDGAIVFTLPEPACFTLEPYGRHNALHLFVDPPETDRPDPEDAGLLYYGPGEHDVGQIELKSGQTLYLDAGAVVYACVTARDARDVRICGRGILDNSRNLEKLLYAANARDNDAAVKNALRQHTVQLEYCTRVVVEDITVRDSLVYTLRPVGCEDLRVSRVKIIGNWRFNSDGIDMHNCRNVLVEDCFLRTFDDSVCVKGFDCYYEGDVEAAVRAAMYRNGKAYDVFRNVTVRRCTIWNDWGKALEIGAETRAEEICGVVFEDCRVIHVTGPVLDCMNVDYADVHDVVFRDVEIEFDDVIPQPLIQRSDDEPYAPGDRDYAPPVFSASVLFHPEYSAGGSRRGRNRGITVERVSLLGRQTPVFTCSGIDAEHTCSGVTIRFFRQNGIPAAPGSFVLETDGTCREIRVETDPPGPSGPQT